MASLEACDTMSQDSMRTHSRMPDRERRGKINKKEIPQPQSQEGIKHRRQSLYLRPDSGEREGE